MMAGNKGNIPNIEKTQGPDGAVAEDYIAFTDKYTDTRYVPGDTFPMSGVKEKDGFTLVEAKAVEMPPYSDRDKSLYEDYDLQLCITIHADASKYKADKDLAKKVKKWLIGKNDIKVIKEDLVSSNEDCHVGKITVLLDGYCRSEYIGDIKDSELYENLWKKYMNQLIKEGVCYVKGKVPGILEQSLRRNIDELAEKTPVDYHPNSNNIVRDLVHPALYSYIKGVSKLKENQEADPSTEDDNEMDFWGRIYEDSKFQWLPTPFKITDDGKCLIQEYINNLDQNMFPKLYEDLQSLFEVFLPYFEETWSYAQAMEFFDNEDDDDEVEKVPELDKKPVSFKGQELQIITKIVEYKLQPGQSYEGVWHAEGMSHENIVMTGKKTSIKYMPVSVRTT